MGFVCSGETAAGGEGVQACTPMSNWPAPRYWDTWDSRVLRLRDALNMSEQVGSDGVGRGGGGGSRAQAAAMKTGAPLVSRGAAAGMGGL